MVYCKNCGARVRRARYCTSCGTLLVAKAPRPKWESGTRATGDGERKPYFGVVGWLKKNMWQVISFSLIVVSIYLFWARAYFYRYTDTPYLPLLHIPLTFFNSDKMRALDLKPDMISALITIAMIGTLLVRGVLKPSFLKTSEGKPGGQMGILSYLSLIADFCFISTLIHILISPQDSDTVIESLWNNKPLLFVIAALVLCILGMRDVARFMIPAVIVACSLNLITVNQAMGINGFFVVLLAALSYLIRYINRPVGFSLKSDFLPLVSQRT